jgi:hypothetical protein
VKLLLFLLDIGLTNSWVYYKLCNKELCNKEGPRADFFQALAEGLVNTQMNWKEFHARIATVVLSYNQNCVLRKTPVLNASQYIYMTYKQIYR